MRHASSGKTLNEMRDAFIREFIPELSPSYSSASGSSSSESSEDTPPAACGNIDAPYPDDLAAAIVARAQARASSSSSSSSVSPAKRRRKHPELSLEPGELGREVARVLSDDAITIATLQAQPSVQARGYKELATILQAKLTDQRNVLLALLERTEHVVFGGDSAAIGGGTDCEAARSIVGAAIDAAAAAAAPTPTTASASSSSSPSSSSPTTSSADLDALMGNALS